MLLLLFYVTSTIIPVPVEFFQTLVHKSGPKEICNNYRPISFLSPFSKILEMSLQSIKQIFLKLPTTEQTFRISAKL